MKLLLLLAVVLLVAWLWRARRTTPTRGRQAPPPAAPQPQDMVACALCGTHLPQTEAVTGRQGVYCSAEHRQRAES
jgi:uncharacterized protein